ncbi:MFS multidrug transporter-like protein [Xylariomycetidae sp. FL0641]|nr:MFS multidrug transporter-like protein [Xylariomycetidae sp. FL0641]
MLINLSAGLIVISAKISDIIGRKPVTTGLILLFMAFSAGCAASHTMTQLIIIRAFQGLGGGGCFTLAAILIVDSVPPERYGKAVANAGIAIAMGTVLGPLVGGAISEHTTWRWIFLFNIPVCVLALVLLLGGMPNGFPYHGEGDRRQSVTQVLRSISSQLDGLGCVLLLGSVLSFTACFQEAETRFPWDSAFVITLLVAFVALSVALLSWERHITRQSRQREPILPWRFFTNHAMVGVMLVMVLVGGPMSVTTFQLPQRFQLVNGLSSQGAGVRLLPFGAMFPVGSMVGTRIAGLRKVPAIYMVLVGTVFQVVGFALLSTLEPSTHINPSVYGFLILSGFGCGMTYTMTYITVPFIVEGRDKAVGMAAANQFRTMGSAMGIAIATSVFNGLTLPKFADIGISGGVTDLVTGQQPSGVTLPDNVRHILSEGYNRQMLVLCGFSAAQLPVAFLMWKRKPLVV